LCGSDALRRITSDDGGWRYSQEVLRDCFHLRLSSLDGHHDRRGQELDLALFVYLVASATTQIDSQELLPDVASLGQDQPVLRRSLKRQAQSPLRHHFKQL